MITRIKGNRCGLGHRRQVIGLAAGMILSLGLGSEARAQFTGDGTYAIRAAVSGKVLDIDISWFGGHLPGRQLIQWDFHGGANQQFIFRADPGLPGSYSIQPRHSNLCLRVLNWLTADGTIIDQGPCIGGLNQRFRIVPVGNGYYQIQPWHTASALHVGIPYGGDALNNGARLQLRRIEGACSDARMQFAFTRI